MGTCIRMRIYILEFVSNGICGYLYLMCTCIRMKIYILEFVSNGICGYLYLMGTCIRMRIYILEFVSNGICGYLYLMGTCIRWVLSRLQYMVTNSRIYVLILIQVLIKYKYPQIPLLTNSRICPHSNTSTHQI